MYKFFKMPFSKLHFRDEPMGKYKSYISYIGFLNIYGTHVTVTNSTNNNVAFFFVSDSKIGNYNNDQSSNIEERKNICVTIRRQNYSKLSQNRCNPLI